MTDLVPFTYGPDHEMRALTVDGEPWFVAADVARILGYRMASDMTRRLDADDRGTRSVRTPSGEQNMTVVSEAGLYVAVLGSQVEGARSFKRWVTHDVLPAIRKTGGYGQVEMSREELLARAVLESAEVIREKDQRIAELEPSASAWRHMVAADGTYSVGDAAKTLSNDPDISIGQNRLFKFMAALGWLYRAGLRDREAWRVYQPQIECGRLVEKLNRPFLNERSGEYETTAPTVRVTAKGLDELRRQLRSTLTVLEGGAES